MGTRSVIGREQSDGSIRTMFCFLDGGPEGVGQTLLDHYRNTDEIDRLLDLGCLSSLGASPRDPMNHSRLTSLSLRRWRAGREDEPVQQALREKCIIAAGGPLGGDQYDSKNMEELLEKLRHGDAKYLYLWGEGGWIVSEPPSERPESLETRLGA